MIGLCSFASYPPCQKIAAPLPGRHQIGLSLTACLLPTRKHQASSLSWLSNFPPSGELQGLKGQSPDSWSPHGRYKAKGQRLITKMECYQNNQSLLCVSPAQAKTRRKTGSSLLWLLLQRRLPEDLRMLLSARSEEDALLIRPEAALTGNFIYSVTRKLRHCNYHRYKSWQG